MTDSIPSQVTDAIDVGRLHASTDTEVDDARERLRPTLPTTLTDLAAEAERVLSEYANALTGEPQSRAEVERIKWLLKCRESVPWTLLSEDGPLINGKVEAVREAQFIQWCVADLDHADLRRQLAAAELDHRLALAQIEFAKERVRTVRSVLEALASSPAPAGNAILDPEAHLPGACRAHTCDYYTHYLAYGPADLTHEGYHAASKNAEAHMSSCTRWKNGSGPCPVCVSHEQRVRA